jgi:hypothetical protein
VNVLQHLMLAVPGKPTTVTAKVVFKSLTPYSAEEAVLQIEWHKPALSTDIMFYKVCGSRKLFLIENRLRRFTLRTP